MLWFRFRGSRIRLGVACDFRSRLGTFWFASSVIFIRACCIWCFVYMLRRRPNLCMRNRGSLAGDTHPLSV